MKPKVSVIVPVYNAERYLEESLGCITKQMLKDIEIICVDDGSTDGSLGILLKFVDEDERIRVISKPHKDAGAARNAGLAEAKGEYLSFLDADDVFEPDMLEKAYKAAEEKKADIVVFRSDRINVKTGAHEEARWTIREELLSDEISCGAVFERNDIADFLNCFSGGWAWDKLFRTDFVKESGLRFQEQKWINDRYFVTCSLIKARRITIIQDILAHKRVENEGALTTVYTNDKCWKYWIDALQAINGQIKAWELSGEPIEKDYINFAVRNLLWNLDQYTESEGYSECYTDIKIFCERIGLFEKDASMFYRSYEYERVCDLKRKDAEEYRWERLLNKKDGTYLFPFELVPKGSRIVLYGAGKVGQAYYRQVMFSGWCEIVSWVDKKATGETDMVRDPESIGDMEIDHVVIAIRDKEVAGKIKSDLSCQNIPAEQIIWRAPEIEL